MYKVQIYEPVDLELKLKAAALKPVENPYYTKVVGDVAGPDGCTMSIPGFYKGDGVWCIRFFANCTGDWRVTILSSIPELSGIVFDVEAAAQSNPRVHGRVRLDPEVKRHFRYEDGTPCFLLGYEMNWLWAIDQTSENTRQLEALIDGLSHGCFNHFLINAYAYDTNWAAGNTIAEDYGPPPLHPWEGEHDNHDYAKLNTAYWNHFDRMMKVLWERGIVAHIYFKVYNKKVIWPEKRSAEEDLYFDYIVARYQAFPNVIWDFSKESYYEKDKMYMLQRLQRVKKLDAYSHLVTMHDDKISFHTAPYNEVIDFITDQEHFSIYHTAVAQRAFNKPVVNAEFSYEHGPVSSTTWVWGCDQSPEECVHRAYEVVLAGAYPAHYYTSHAWDVIVQEARPVTLDAYRYMYQFVTSFQWQRMIPLPHQAGESTRSMMNEEETELVMYAPKGKMRLFTELGGTQWQGFWMDILTGEKHEEQIKLEAWVKIPFVGRAVVGYFRRMD